MSFVKNIGVVENGVCFLLFKRCFEELLVRFLYFGELDIGLLY